MGQFAPPSLQDTWHTRTENASRPRVFLLSRKNVEGHSCEGGVGEVHSPVKVFAVVSPRIVLRDPHSRQVHYSVLAET